MIDITSIGDDLNVYNTQVAKAGNVLSIQLGSLEYIPEFGIDLRYFLDEAYRFQNESFKAYLIERLANSGVNVASVIETVENLYQQYTLNLSPEETQGGLVAG